MMLGRWRLGARPRPRLPAAAFLLLAVVTSTFAPVVSHAASTDGVARLRHGVRPGELLLERRVVNVSSELAAERAGTKPAATQPAAAIERGRALAEGDGHIGASVEERHVRWRLLDDAAVNDVDGARAWTDPAPSAPTRPARPSRSSSSPPTAAMDSIVARVRASSFDGSSRRRRPRRVVHRRGGTGGGGGGGAPGGDVGGSAHARGRRGGVVGWSVERVAKRVGFWKRLGASARTRRRVRRGLGPRAPRSRAPADGRRTRRRGGRKDSWRGRRSRGRRGG